MTPNQQQQRAEVKEVSFWVVIIVVAQLAAFGLHERFAIPLPITAVIVTVIVAVLDLLIWGRKRARYGKRAISATLVGVATYLVVRFLS